MRTLDYNHIPSSPYPHQVTITTYPGFVARLFGASKKERVIASRDWELYAGWYEIPSMREVSTISSVLPEIHRMLRQMRFVEGR